MILVTGAAGFIPSNLCHYLTSLGNEVIGIDAMLTGSSIKNLYDIGETLFNLIVLDVRDEYNLEHIFRQYRINQVYHLAAESHVDRSIAGDLSFWTTNIIGTRNIMKMGRKYNCRVLNQITDEVFGPKPTGLSTETDPLLPTSPYAASKASQYLVGQSYFKTYGVDIVSTFPANTYGPRQYPEKLIPKFIQKLQAGARVPLMSSIHFKRDWLAIPDHIEALIYIMNRGIAGEGYNIPGMGCITNKKITEMILEVMNKSWENSVEIVEDRKAHDCRYSVSGEKLSKLGWSPKIKLEDYLPEVIEWYNND